MEKEKWEQEFEDRFGGESLIGSKWLGEIKSFIRKHLIAFAKNEIEKIDVKMEPPYFHAYGGVSCMEAIDEQNKWRSLKYKILSEMEGGEK
jgi:hypothetical protein